MIRAPADEQQPRSIHDDETHPAAGRPDEVVVARIAAPIRAIDSGWGEVMSVLTNRVAASSAAILADTFQHHQDPEN